MKPDNNLIYAKLIALAAIIACSFIALEYAIRQSNIFVIGFYMTATGAITAQVLSRCAIRFTVHNMFAAFITAAYFVLKFVFIGEYDVQIVLVIVGVCPVVVYVIEQLFVNSQKVNMTVVLALVAALVACCLIPLVTSDINTVVDMRLVLMTAAFALTIFTSRLSRTKLKGADPATSLVIGLYLSACCFALLSIFYGQTAMLSPFNISGLIAILLGVITTGIGMLFQDSAAKKLPVYIIEVLSLSRLLFASAFLVFMQWYTQSNSHLSLLFLLCVLTYLTAIHRLIKQSNTNHFNKENTL